MKIWKIPYYLCIDILSTAQQVASIWNCSVVSYGEHNDESFKRNFSYPFCTVHLPH